MTITGGTQAVGILLSLIRMKVLALLLGPGGVGVLSIYTNLQAAVSTAAGLGLGSSGVRQIAKNKGATGEVERIRRVLLWANLFQGMLAMSAVWVFRYPIAAWLFNKPGFETEVGVIGIAVLLSLVSASQTALLRGLRKISDLGRVTVLGAFAGTIIGVAAIWWLGMQGLLWLVIAQPLTAVLIAVYFTRKLPRSKDVVLRSPVKIFRIWSPMVKLGAGFMLGGLATSGALLLVRGKIVNELGIDAAGQFAAAWGITMTYVGFLLNAMSMDYYPRLAEVIDDKKTTTRLMNDQMQIGMAIGMPILVLLIGLAPLVVRILYSEQFENAVVLLQWQTAGNILKLASWSLSISVVAAARSKLYLIMEACFLLPFITICYVLIPVFGLSIAGISFLVSYAIYFLASLFMARHVVGFSFEMLSLKLLGAAVIVACCVLLSALMDPVVGAAVGTLAALVTGFIGGHILLEKIGTSRYTRHLVRIYTVCRWPISEP